MGAVIDTVVAFAVTIIVGYVLAQKGILDEHTSGRLTKIVLNICIPASMLVNVVEYFSLEILAEASWRLLVPFLIVGTSYAVAMLACRLFKIPKRRHGVFCGIFAMSNTVFVGLPVAQALFGEQASVLALFYFLGNTLIFWTVAVYNIRCDGGQKSKLISADSFKKLFTPALIALFIGLFLLLIRVKVPSFIMSAATMLTKPSTPLAMLIAGQTIHRAIAQKTWKRLDVLPAVLGCVVITPAIAYGITTLMGVTGLMQAVYVSQAAMPVMSQIPIIARAYGADDELATAGLLLSMLALVVVMPVLGLLFT
jgi:predicted permease